MYILYRLTTTVTPNMRKTSSNAWSRKFSLGSPAIVSKFRIDRLIEVKYNKINPLGILNGDRVRLIKVTA